MAILDKNLIFYNNEVVPAGGIANIDLGAGGDAIGQELTLTIVSNDGYSGESIQFCLGTADKAITLEDENIPDGSAEKGALVSSPTVSDVPVGGVIFQCRVPKGAKRYLYLADMLGLGTGGKKITAYLSKEL